ncbi:MAG: RNA polymerase-binding protein DksA, partial [Acidibacter sp.]|nr:RNA polymerase-binding protein DksA [Acidibacter sp.]
MPAKKPAAKAAKNVKSATPTARQKASPSVASNSASKTLPKKKTGKATESAAAVETTVVVQKAVESAPNKPAPAKSKPTGITATFVQRNPRPIAPVQTDGDDEENNLLTGPRNVQPYIVKRGEQYMNREQLDHFRQILESWKRDLMVEVDRTVSHMKDEAANFPDPNDRATQEEEFSLELRTRDRERKLIRKIEEALKRIEDGSYGYCLETGEEIGIKRLEA